MNKWIIIFISFVICSCVSKQIKHEEVQNKLVQGMSVADVIAALGIPKEKSLSDSKVQQLTYNSYIFNFVDDKLTTAKSTQANAEAEVSLKSLPNYKPNSLVLNKDVKTAICAYEVAAYLKDETLFIQAIESGVNLNWYTTRSNALCIALTEGFVKATAAVLKAGFNDELRLSNDNGGYMTPDKCVDRQKDPAVASELKKLLAGDSKNKKSDGAKKNDSESSFAWKSIEDWLKSQAPVGNK